MDEYVNGQVAGNLYIFKTYIVFYYALHNKLNNMLLNPVQRSVAEGFSGGSHAHI